MTKVERDWNSCGTKDSFFTDGSSIGLNGIEGGFGPEVLALNHESRILGHSNHVCAFSIMELVRLCAVWPTENRIGSSTYRFGRLSEYATVML